MAPSGPLGWGHHPLWKEIGAPQKKNKLKKNLKKRKLGAPGQGLLSSDFKTSCLLVTAGRRTEVPGRFRVEPLTKTSGCLLAVLPRPGAPPEQG